MNSKFLIPIKRSGPAAPIFFVPAAGSTIISFVYLARSLKAPRPFYAFEFTELPTGRSRPRTIEQIASLCVGEIKAVQETGPYAIGGHCWGGLVAFAIAAKLEAMGEAVAALTLLESVPPVSDIAPDDSEETNAAMREAETASALLTLRAQVKEKLSRLPAEQAERFGQLSWELIEMSPDYRAPRIKAPLFLFRTPTHPKAVFQNWSQLSTGKLDERIVPGDAYSILAAPAVKLLGSRLDEALV